MGFEALLPLLAGLATVFATLLKQFFGNDKPQVTTVVKAKPEIDTTKQTTDQEKLHELGI